MKNTIVSRLFVAGFLLVSLFLSVGVLVAGPSAAGANELLSSAPVLVKEDGSFNEELLSQTAAWFNDHFFGRQELISLNNRLTALLTGTATADNVIQGSNDWLYYGATLADYTGTEPLTQRELYSIASNLALMQEASRQMGKTFLFTIAPNKNSLYPENMPDYGVVAQQRDAQRLEALLKQLGIRYADLFAALGQAEEVLYFAHDSHWNSKGAALGADVINAALGRESSYYGDGFSRSVPHQGDLFEMMYPALADSETDPVYGGALEFTYTGSATKADAITLLTQGGGEGSLLMYRDSFGNLLYPYLADSFGASRFSRSTTYDLTVEADFVVIELVERNLRYLITNIPVFIAPVRQLSLPAASGEAQLEITQGQERILVKGTLPDDADSAAFVVCGETAYAATLLENNGFAAYMPADAQVTAVAYFAGGQLRLLERADGGEDAGQEDPVPTETLPPTTDTTTEPKVSAKELANSCLDKPVAELYALIGQPVSAEYAPSCLGAGEDGCLYYEGFTVFTYKNAEGETVTFVE